MRAQFLILGLLPALLLAAVACGEDAPIPTSVPTADRAQTAAPETTEVPAPIDGVELNIDESDPPQYFLEVTSGLFPTPATRSTGSRRNGPERRLR